MEIPKDSVAELWRQYLQVDSSSGIKFVNAALLDKIAGREIRNKRRQLEQFLDNYLDGYNLTDRQRRDFLRTVRVKKCQTSIMVAAGIMQRIILHGFHNFPWNENRRAFVAHFFSAELLPLTDPYSRKRSTEAVVVPSPEPIPTVTPGSEPIPTATPGSEPIPTATPGSEPTAVATATPRSEPNPRATKRSESMGTIVAKAILTKRKTRYERKWKTREGSIHFWKLAISYARTKGIRLDTLVELARKDQKRRIMSEGKTESLLTTMIRCLFPYLGTPDSFRTELAIALKSSNAETIFNAIRDRLFCPVLPRAVVPSYRNTKRKMADLNQYFIASCKAERCFTGFRVDLVSSVKLAALLMFDNDDLKEVCVDIGGDGYQLGGMAVTRFVFRILCEKVSAQSTDSVFCFAVYRGKDSRYGMELNLGSTVAGEQETGWLFQQTQTLRKLGAKVTYSGDNPFLLHLIVNQENDLADATPSKLGLYVGQKELAPHTCGPDGRRTSVQIPFRAGIPRESLVSFDDIRCVIPDVTHMIVRIVENDLRRVCSKLIQLNQPLYNHSVEQFEENLTSRDARKPRFIFEIQMSKGEKVPSVSIPSLCGAASQTVIAEASELSEKDPNMKGLYEGVFSKTTVVPGSSDDTPARTFLREHFPGLFNEVHPTTGDAGYISFHDAVDLMRRSLNQCVILLRNSRGGLDVAEFSKWADTHFHTTVLLFGDTALVPYKLKMCLFPTLVASGFARAPWYHMCEALEKSNHHAHKDYQTKTMRGGGRHHQHDPLFLELVFSFYKMLRTSSAQSNIDEVMRKLKSCVDPQLLERTYLQICKASVEPPQVAVGKLRPRNELLMGMRFYVMGQPRYTGTVVRNKDGLETLIKELGGQVISKDQAETIIYSHSRTPNCFVVVKDDTELKKGTTSREAEDSTATTSTTEIPAKNTSTTEIPAKNTSKTEIPAKNITAAQTCKWFAGTQFTFVTWHFVWDVHEKNQIQDPYSERYKLEPGPDVKPIIVNDVNGLLRHQCDPDNEGKPSVSAVVALKRHRRNLEKRVSEADERPGEDGGDSESEEDGGDSESEEDSEDGENDESQDDQLNEQLPASGTFEDDSVIFEDNQP